MSCCGKMRERMRSEGASVTSERAPPERQFAVRFAYVGASALTVIGSVSGRRYRFERKGAELTVDPRDRPGLARLPLLRALTST